MHVSFEKEFVVYLIFKPDIEAVEQKYEEILGFAVESISTEAASKIKEGDEVLLKHLELRVKSRVPSGEWRGFSNVGNVRQDMMDRGVSPGRLSSLYCVCTGHSRKSEPEI